MSPRPRATSTSSPVSWTHPSALLALAAVAVAVIALQAFRRPDPELWWQLALGQRTLSGGPPAASFGTWFDAGGTTAPPSVLFGVLAQTAWRSAEALGLLTLRALLAIGAFAAAALAATRTARAGLPSAHASRSLAAFSLLVLVAWCALIARPGAQAAPLQLAALWLGLQLLVLEDWRAGGRAAFVALPALAVAWANTDASWCVGVGVNVAALAGAFARREPRARALAAVTLGAFAASFLQPGGPFAAGELFAFLRAVRAETVYRGLPDLQPLSPIAHARSLAPLALLLWPLARLFSSERPRDPGPLLVALGLGALAFAFERFLGLWAVACVALFGRDVVRWSTSGAGAVRPWARAAVTVLACALAVTAHATDASRRPGVGLDRSGLPEHAVEFLRRYGVQGPLFNAAPLGSYLAWRAPAGGTPLPFVDLRFRGTPADRVGYLAAFTTDADWRRLDARHGFQAVLVERYQAPGSSLLDRLDADSSWTLVFADDAAALWVRRDGANAALARARAYEVPVGRRGFEEFVTNVVVDGMVLDRRREALLRMIQDSPNHRLTLTMLVATEMALGLESAARLHVRDGLARWPDDRALRAMLAQMEGV